MATYRIVGTKKPYTGRVIEIGGILVDENLAEKERFNLRCRLP